MVVVKAVVHPAEVLSTLRSGGATVDPTERWAAGWTPGGGHLTTKPCVYGIYGRRIPVTKWLSLEVRDLLGTYPGEVGAGTMPGGLDPFSVKSTDVQGLGEWVLIYVGQSGATSQPRISNYFGRTPHLTREPGGQSFHLMLTLLFGLPVDPRVPLRPRRARTVIDVLRGSLSLSLEARMRDMRFSYVQVETTGAPACGPACLCGPCAERHLIGSRADIGRTPDVGWPTGARPLMNSCW